MDNLQSHNPFILSSMYQGPTILNMAGTDEEDENTDEFADADTESEDNDDTHSETESQSQDATDESDEENDETPAGKAFARQRAALKIAKAAAIEANEKRIRAEARAEATEELLAKYGKGKPEETEEVDTTNDINPEDEKVIEAYLRKKGIDTNALKSLPQSVQRDQMERQIDKVCSVLEKKYAGSIPFDREKVLKYAVDNGFAAAMPNAPLDKVLELAHKDMNEDALMDWKMEARKKKKDAPTPSGNGTGKKKIVEDQPENVSGFRNRARSRVGSDD